MLLPWYRGACALLNMRSSQGVTSTGWVNLAIRLSKGLMSGKRSAFLCCFTEDGDRLTFVGNAAATERLLVMTAKVRDGN